MGSQRENRRINIDNDKDKNKDDTKILLRVHGADLRRFGKNKYKGSFIAVIRGGGVIYSGLLSNIGNEDDTSNNNALGITTVHDNYKKWNNEEAEDTCARPYSCISIWKGEAHLILKRISEVQGADLWRFSKHKKRPTLWMGEYPPVMNCTFFCGTQGIKVWIGKHHLPSYAVHKWNCRIVILDLVNLIASPEFILVG